MEGLKGKGMDYVDRSGTGGEIKKGWMEQRFLVSFEEEVLVGWFVFYVYREG